MTSKQRQIKASEMWIKCYEELSSVSKAARKCGIPRSTLYRWINRYEAEGKESTDRRDLRCWQSKRPLLNLKHSLNLSEQSLNSVRREFKHTCFESMAWIFPRPPFGGCLRKTRCPISKNIASKMSIPAIAGPFRAIEFSWMSPK